MVRVQDQRRRKARRSCGGGRGCAAEGGLEAAPCKGKVGRLELPEEEEGWRQRRLGSSRGRGEWAVGSREGWPHLAFLQSEGLCRGEDRACGRSSPAVEGGVGAEEIALIQPGSTACPSIPSCARACLG